MGIGFAAMRPARSRVKGGAAYDGDKMVERSIFLSEPRASSPISIRGKHQNNRNRPNAMALAIVGGSVGREMERRGEDGRMMTPVRSDVDGASSASETWKVDGTGIGANVYDETATATSASAIADFRR